LRVNFEFSITDLKEQRPKIKDQSTKAYTY